MDGTENPEGLSSEGQTSEGEAQGTSTDKAKTYTVEEVNKAIEKAKNDALAKAGREDKTLAEKKADLDAREESVKARLARIEEWERQQDTAELAEAQKDPDKMRAYRDKQADKTRAKTMDERETDLKKREGALSKREAEAQAKVTAAEEAMLGMTIYEIAARHDLNPEDLKAGVKDLNLKTVEQAESLAKRMTTGKRPPEGEGEGEVKPITPVPVPTSGGSRKDFASVKFDASAPSSRAMISKGLNKK
jgi:hypothetical protein